MQRTRPRLKLFSITCSLPECGKSAVRFYPTRPGARSRIRFTYCCDAHSKRHWARLRRQQIAAEDPPYPCAGPRCSVMIEPVFAPGQRKLYHDDACRERAKAERSRRQPAGDVRVARAKTYKAMQEAAVALQQAASHAAAFAQWRETDYADVMRRFARVKEKAAAAGREPTPSAAFIDLLEQTLNEAEAHMVWQEKLDGVASRRAALAHWAGASLRRVEGPLGPTCGLNAPPPRRGPRG